MYKNTVDARMGGGAFDSKHWLSASYLLLSMLESLPPILHKFFSSDGYTSFLLSSTSFFAHFSWSRHSVYGILLFIILISFLLNWIISFPLSLFPSQNYEIFPHAQLFNLTVSLSNWPGKISPRRAVAKRVKPRARYQQLNYLATTDTDNEEPTPATTRN